MPGASQRRLSLTPDRVTSAMPSTLPKRVLCARMPCTAQLNAKSRTGRHTSELARTLNCHPAKPFTKMDSNKTESGIALMIARMALGSGPPSVWLLWASKAIVLLTYLMSAIMLRKWKKLRMNYETPRILTISTDVTVRNAWKRWADFPSPITAANPSLRSYISVQKSLIDPACLSATDTVLIRCSYALVPQRTGSEQKSDIRSAGQRICDLCNCVRRHRQCANTRRKEVSSAVHRQNAHYGPLGGLRRSAEIPDQIHKWSRDAHGQAHQKVKGIGRSGQGVAF